MRISDWSSDVCATDLEWVRHEIKRSYELGKGLLAIDIHSVKDPQLGTDRQGTNPLSYFTIKQNGRDIPLSNLYGTYDWVRDNGYANMPAWIETAAKAIGRASCRERGWKYVEISVVAVSLIKKNN